MRYKATVLLIALFSVFNRAFCQTQWSNEEIQNILMAQFKDFKPLADFYRVSWDSITFTTAHQSHIVFEAKNVMINLNQVKKHVDNESVAFVHLFCDYLLAHEFAHKFQFNFFRKETFEYLNADNRIYLECHADMIAPVFFVLVEAQRNWNNRGWGNQDLMQTNHNRSQLLQLVYSKLFTMDQANVNVTTHPTHDQRLLALQEGLILAYCNSWSNYDSTKDTSNIIYNRHLQQQIAEVGKAIGYSIAADSLSDPFYWASLEAARILHHNNMLANGVITFNKRTDWYSSQRPPRIVTYPSVEYSFDVYNSNSVKITFAGRVYTYCMDTNSNNEVFQLTIIDGESFSIQIEPGHTATISGEIKWGSPYAWCLPGTTPYIVLPGDRHSVYWVYEGDRPKHDSIRWDSFHFSIEEWDENSTDEVIDLIKYISHPSHDLHNYLRGIGSSDAISADQLESAPKYYQSLFNAGNPKNQTIHVLPDGKATFWIKLNQTSDSSKAGNIYDGMVTKLKKKFPQLATTLNNGHIEFRDEKSNITVFNAFDPYLKQYVLSLGITR